MAPPFDTSSDTFHGENHTDHAQHRATGIKDDHCGLPGPALVVPEVEIKAVETVIDPSLDTLATRKASYDLAHLRINVKPRCIGIGKLHA